jgi:hypothetical protein
MGVTVGIVNYNLARFLPRAILSARRAQEVIQMKAWMLSCATSASASSIRKIVDRLCRDGAT